MRATTNVSNALEAALENGVENSNGHGIVNPYSRKKAVLNTLQLATSTTTRRRPLDHQQPAFSTPPSRRPATPTRVPTSRARSWRCWTTATNSTSIQIFYVDGNGRKSPFMNAVAVRSSAERQP